LATVRVDLQLDPKLRLTEQERAFITAMLVDLVTVISDEIAAASAINDNGSVSALFQSLRSSGLLDIPALVEIVLRRAEEERLCAALRAEGGSGRPRFVHSLAGDQDAGVAAAAMALVLGRSRRKDRFGGPRVQLDDLPAEAAVKLVYSVAAVVGRDSGDHASSSAGAAAILTHHDEGKRLESLGFALVHALDSADRLDEKILHSAVVDGEVALFVEALSRRGGIDFESGWTLLRSGDGLAILLRLAGISRPCAAEIIGCFGDLLPGGADSQMLAFDSIADQRVQDIRDTLRLDRHYRAAFAATES
jgi:hypothetical protein